MGLLGLLLPWTLLVQVQLQLCQDGVCKPYPALQDKSRVVRTLDSEADCLALQIQVQQELHKTRTLTSQPVQARRHVTAKTTLVCVPGEGGSTPSLSKEDCTR
jgi:hypothetical protein